MATPRRTLLVEFVGLPGAGKSTLAHQVAELLGQAEIPVEESLRKFAAGRRVAPLARKLALVSKEVLCRPWFAYRSARAVMATRQGSTIDALKVLHNWLWISALMRAKAQFRGVHLFDQGVFQALWSIGYSAGEADLTCAWGRLCLMVTKPDLVVIVQAEPPRIVKRRVATRPAGGSRIEKLPPDHPLWAKSEHLLRSVKNVIAQLAESDKGIKTTVVDNSQEGGSQEAASGLARYISRLYTDTALGCGDPTGEREGYTSIAVRAGAGTPVAGSREWVRP